MNTGQFWETIETAKHKSPKNSERQVKLIRQTLESLSAKEIFAFDRIYDRLRFRAYSWDLWEAAKMLRGGCSDDGFEYFRAWLISRGRKVYEAAMRNPDSLVKQADDSRDDYELESMLYVASYAYKAATGQSMPIRDSGYPKLKGTRCKSESKLRKRLPRLYKLLGATSSAEDIVAMAKRSLARSKTWASKMTALSLVDSLETLPPSGVAVLQKAARDEDESIRRVAKFKLRQRRLRK